MRKIRTVNELFAAFGGPAAIGRVLGIRTEHATTMRRRQSIAMTHWDKVIRAGKDRKIILSVGDLRTIHLNTKKCESTEEPLRHRRPRSRADV